MTMQAWMGLALAFIWCAINTAAWWSEAKRGDRLAAHNAVIAADNTRLRNQPHHLHALVTHHLELLDMTDPEPDTAPIPVIEGEPTIPSDLPTQVHQALIARRPVPTPRTHTSPADDPEWRRRFGLEVQA